MQHKKIENHLDKAKQAIRKEDLLEAVCQTENAALELRNILVEEVLPQEDYDRGPAVIFPLRVEVEGYEDGLMITLPLTLPRRSEGDRARYVAGALSRKLREYCHLHPTPYFQKCVLVYEFVYASTNRRRPTDHDNLELKHCQDVLERFVLTNDSPLLCSSFLCSHRGEETCTRIWVLSPAQFSTWLETHSDCWRGADPQ